MGSSGGKIWFVDTRGNAFPRSELIQALDGEPQEVGPTSKPRSVMLEIAKALVGGGDLSLAAGETGRAVVLKTADTRCLKPSPQGDQWERLRWGAAGESVARFGMLTSGSTGIPKCVWQSVRQLARAVQVSDRHANAIWGLAYPPTHVAGVQVILQALANGCPVVDLQGLSGAEVAAAIQRHRVTHLSATPTFYRLLVASTSPLGGVRSATLGGEPVDAVLISRVRSLFPSARIHNVYASTEAGTLLVSDGDTFSIPAGLDDRIVIRSELLWVHRSFLGAFVGGKSAREEWESQRSDGAREREGGITQSGMPPAQREVTSAGALWANEEQKLKILEGDWYDTGDRVEVIDQNPLRFRIVGRDRDWFNVGGHKVNPREVEAVLERCPGVNRARVSGRPNSVVGTLLTAELECAVVAPSEATVRAFAAERLPAYQVPRLLKVVDKLPATWTGKLKRE